jgi:CheY-like chemotaxis protein
MKCRYFEIDEQSNSVVEKSSIPDGSILSRCLKEAGNSGTGAELVIFLANHHEFWQLRFLYELVEKCRDSASVRLDNENIGITRPWKPTPPILTIYSSDAFGNAKRDKNKFGQKYWDSSIWQRWVDMGPLDNRSTGDEEKYKTTPMTVLRQLNWNFDFACKKENGEVVTNLYAEDPATLEFSEFFTRVYKNSYIADVAADRGGHAGEVTPFPFLEESEFFRLYRQSKLFTRENGNKLKWRVLLVDDKEERLTHLKMLFRSEEFGAMFDVLEKEDDPHTKPALFFHQVRRFADVKKVLQKKDKHTPVFDIILLDYLLDAEKENRRLSIDLFPDKNAVAKPGGGTDWHFDDPFVSTLRGPDDKFWIFLTSCYHSALLDGLRERGISFQEICWNINRGADPVNTPNTFLYNFAGFLDFQLSSFHSEDKNIHSIWVDALNGLTNENIRGWANNTLGKILNYSSNIDSLREIPTSLFADSFLKSGFNQQSEDDYASGAYGYLTHLLFLLTSGDGNKWDEMKTDLEMVKEIIPAGKGYGILQSRIETLKKQYGL